MLEIKCDYFSEKTVNKVNGKFQKNSIQKLSTFSDKLFPIQNENREHYDDKQRNISSLTLNNFESVINPTTSPKAYNRNNSQEALKY